MILDRFSVDGQTAIVTGASSSIGCEIAEQFAAGGANVVICSREQENVDPVAETINEEANDGVDGNGGDGNSGRAVAIECDVTDREAVETLVEATAEEFGSIDCPVNNAGASIMADFDDISPNDWSTIVDINLTGTYHCTQAAGEYPKDGGGTAINLASVAGQIGPRT